MKIKRCHKKAFSMIELSIAILIISVIAVSFISISQSTRQASGTSSDIEKINKIYKAITSFVSTNRRLPCPALLTITKGSASYGEEVSTPGTCTGLEVAATNVVYGMIPFRDLGISQEDVEDSYGTRFSYAVDRRFTKKTASSSSTDGFEVIRAMPFVNDSGESSSIPYILPIENPKNSVVKPNALFVIIAHGANKSNGWPASSAVQNPSVTSDEASNAGRSTSSEGLVHNEYFVAGSTQSGFDDIVLYKDKNELAKDTGLINMICSGYELIPPSGTCQIFSWSSPSLKNANYLQLIISNLSAGYGCTSKCEGYGVWEIETTFICGSPPC